MRYFLIAALLGLPGTAFAHAILIDSQPAAGSTVAAGQTNIVLRYNSRIDQQRSRLTLAGSNAEMVLKLKPGIPAETLAAQPEELTPGQYTVRWQVLAVDGHITRGEVRFTVKPR